jgi:hypothetical protein
MAAGGDETVWLVCAVIGTAAIPIHWRMSEGEANDAAKNYRLRYPQATIWVMPVINGLSDGALQPPEPTLAERNPRCRCGCALNSHVFLAIGGSRCEGDGLGCGCREFQRG